MPCVAVYPGTFDPMTNGHLDLATRASRFFTKVVIAVAPTHRKEPFLSIDERITLIAKVLQPIVNVQVVQLNGLLIDVAHQYHARVIVRGLRAVSDFDYEFQLAHMNHRMAPDVETVFLPGSEKHSYISGTMVREIIGLGGDISCFVPSIVAQYLAEKFAQQ